MKHAVKHSARYVKQYVKQQKALAAKQSGDSGNKRGNVVRRRSSMSGALVKDMLRMWVRNWKRFLSITFITTLGVAILVGIHAGCLDMFAATNRFYNAQGLYDIQAMSTLGMTDDDISALKGVQGVEDVQAERSATIYATIDGTQKTVTMSEIGTNGMNRPYLLDGTMPKSSGQIAVTRKFIKDSGLKIGDTLTVSTSSESSDDSSTQSNGDSSTEDSNTASSDTADTEDADDADGTEDEITFPTSLTITAVVLDPEDLSNPDGYESAEFRSTSTVDYTFFAPSDGVSGDVYSAISMRVNGAADLDTFTSSYDQAVSTVIDRIEESVQTKRQDARRQQLIDEANQKIADARAEADDQFAQAQAQIDENQASLNQQLAAMGATTEQMQQTVIVSNAQLQQAQAQIDSAQQELNQRKADADAEFEKQSSEVESNIPKSQWYINTRASVGSFSNIKSDISSIDSLGIAFPVVFLLVAVLMTLTAMTRMVEEDRGLIGTYMGLGYGHVSVSMRYVLFALLACLIGGGLGDLVGFLGIPAFLLKILEGLYIVPGVSLEYDWLYGSAGVLLFVVGVLIVTIIASRSEMRHMSAVLMRPKAPKAGARVPLELIPALWRRMKFLNKVMVRNIFRFKGRLIMTIGGVAGCTALIVCGLALNDTVATLGSRQYGGVYQYDMMSIAADGDMASMRQRLKDDGRTTATMLARVENGELVTGGDESEKVQLVTVADASQLPEMVSLSNADGGGSIALNDDGIIVSKSAAASLGVKSGETVTMANGERMRGEVTVTALNRNLIGTDVYMTAACYDKLFDSSNDTGSTDATDSSDSTDSASEAAKDVNVNTVDGVEMNAVYAKLSGSDDSQIEYVDQLKDYTKVLTAMSTKEMRQTFKFDLMIAVVALIVAFAGGLALVVLFVLANTNVSERVREIATLKVLGFYDREVHAYVNKETIILTIAGVVVGLPLGRLVASLLTNALNLPGLYFEIEIQPWSYAIAAAVTLAFALLVQLMTNPVLDRVDPASSLKSVE